MDKNSTNKNIFQEIFEQSSAAMLLINAEGIIIMLNNSFCELSGYSKEELIGIEWVSKIPQEDRSKLKEINQRRLLKDPNVPNKYEIRYYTKSGKLQIALLSASLIEQTSQIICTVIDITQRKLKEEEERITKDYYQSIVEYAGDITFSISPNGYFNYISPVSLKKLGYKPEEIIGIPFAAYVHQDDQREMQKYFEQVVIKGEKISNIEFRAKHKDGEWRWFSINASPIFNDDGVISAIIGIGIEITDRKKIETDLQRSEKLLWTLFNSISDMIWLKDTDGKFIACNIATQQIIGKTQDEIIGKTDHDLFKKEDADFEIRKDKEVITNNEESRYENKIYFSSFNQEMLLDVIKTPIHKQNGELIGVLGIARDITERKQMEEKLSESLVFFRESQRAGFIGSYKYSFDTETWESSEVLDQIFGVEPGYEMNIENWFSIIHPDDQKTIVPELMSKIELKEDFDAEYRIIRQSDKAIRWVHGIGKLACDENDNNKFLIGTVRDITKRKLAEETAYESQTKLSIALKLAHLGPWEYNIEEKQFYFGDTFYALFKTTTGQEGANTMTIEDYTKKFVHPDDHSIVEQEIQKSLLSKESVYIRQIEHRMLYANGEEGIIAVQIACIKDQKSVKLFGINQDITAIKRAEIELRESAKELQELNSMKDKFFSIIAHDLKGPFASIMGFSELLILKAKQNSPEKINLFAKSILESSKMAMDLLANLLDWSRAETGRMEFSPNNINLVELLNDSIGLLMPTAKQKKINLQPIANSNSTVFADSAMLSTVFRNLISNAIKFTYQGGEVKVLIQKNETEWLIKVIDTGVGIPEQNIEKMFRIDQNESTLGTNNEKGTGLGLILCKEFVEKHGGKIWVNSQIDIGSEFCFTLPIYIPEQ